MSNVLPHREYVNVKRMMRMRFVTAGLLLFFYTATIASVALFPSYVSLRVKEKNVNDQLTEIKKEDFSKESASLNIVVQDINAKLRAFPQTPEPLPSETVIAPLLLASHPGISITDMSMTKNKEAIDIVLQGTSRTREQLVQFVDALKARSEFTGVSLPLSQLVKDKNAAFTLSFSMAHK
jgi:hypothetical protein